jgi:CheY-like chemotaxis protein/HPt (histidine-containing phosphotransfer) domain-containing protein
VRRFFQGDVILSKAQANLQRRVVSRKVLLVEGNPVNQRVAVGLLARRGHRVTVANNGREALTALDENDPFDVVLMDVQMPDMDALEATTRIRKREQRTGERLRIIAMTGHAMKGDRERFLALGMDAYLPKPVAPQALFDLIESVLVGRQPSDGDPSASLSLDVDAMRRRLGDDDELIADVIRLFLEDCPARVDAIAAALEATDAAQLRTMAHALKGSASALSAHRVVNAAHTLESLAGANDVVAARTHFPGLVEEVGRLIGALQELQKRR